MKSIRSCFIVGAAVLGGCASQAGQPVRYACPGEYNNVRLTPYSTVPPTVLAERDGRAAVLTREIASSGARYVNGEDMVWERDGEALVRWNGAEQTCKRL